MKKFGLTGYPIAHSKSPALFEAAYGGRDSYNLIETPDFPTAYKTFLDGYDAINVTAPFKGEACAAAGILSHGCIVTGAANVLKKTSKGVEAWNTDIDGVRACIHEMLDCPVSELTCANAADPSASTHGHHHHEPKIAPKYGVGRTALVVGCGGAGKAAAFAAVLEEFNLVLMNRNALKAEVYARKLVNMGKAPAGTVTTAPLEDFPQQFAQADLVIWALPLKTAELDVLERMLDQAEGEFKGPQAIIEANYKDPAFSTSLARKLNGKGVRICTGERWLLHQGVAAYKIFTGEAPDIEAMAKVL